MGRDLPIGVAQQKVITALGGPSAIQSWSGAEAYFERIGIRVRAVRVGRGSEPRVRLRNPAGGGWNEGGDGESWDAVHSLIDDQIAELKRRDWWEE